MKSQKNTDFVYQFTKFVLNVNHKFMIYCKFTWLLSLILIHAFSIQLAQKRFAASIKLYIAGNRLQCFFVKAIKWHLKAFNQAFHFVNFKTQFQSRLPINKINYSQYKLFRNFATFIGHYSASFKETS